MIDIDKTRRIIHSPAQSFQSLYTEIAETFDSLEYMSLPYPFHHLEDGDVILSDGWSLEMRGRTYQGAKIIELYHD